MNDKTIAAFDPIKSEIENLKKDYAIVPDCKTDEGFDQAKKDYRYIRKFEINLEDARKKLNKADQDRITKRNTQAKKIDAALKEVSKPFKDAVDARKEELQALEAKRVSDIQERIADITNFVSEAIGKDSGTVSGIIEAVDLIEIDETFQEFVLDAGRAIENTKQQLAQELQNALNREENERLRKELEAAQAKTQETMHKAEDVVVEIESKNVGNDKVHDEAKEADPIWHAFTEISKGSYIASMSDFDIFKAGVEFGINYERNRIK